jgi:hypothetical protein
VLDVYLVDADGAPHEAGALPPGRYTVMASFKAGAAPRNAGYVELEPGQELVLTCTSIFHKCQ